MDDVEIVYVRPRPSGNENTDIQGVKKMWIIFTEPFVDAEVLRKIVALALIYSFLFLNVNTEIKALVFDFSTVMDPSFKAVYSTPVLSQHVSQ